MTWVVPVLILLGIVAVMALAQWGLKRRVEDRDQQADHTDPVPSTHVAEDEQTPLGDTSEAHDELSPHDLPKDHPGRTAAEQRAGARR